MWLASFDSLWKFLDDQAAGGLEQAVQQGVGFIHTGGPGSFHGGSGMGACLDFTSLAEALPVALRSRNDLVYAQGLVPTAVHGSASIKEIRAEAGAGRGWSERQLREYGLPGFNDVELKPGSEQVLSIAGRPLLVTGQYGQGRTVAFMGFTPDYEARHADWDPKVLYPYLLDQELISNPVNRAYFDLFMRMVGAASGEKRRRAMRSFGRRAKSLCSRCSRTSQQRT